MTKRLLYDIGILISILWFPWWLTLAMFCIGVFVFQRWYEGIAFGFFYDLLYSVGEARFYGFVFVATLATVILLVIAEFLKTKLRSYSI